MKLAYIVAALLSTTARAQNLHPAEDKLCNTYSEVAETIMMGRQHYGIPKSEALSTLNSMSAYGASKNLIRSIKVLIDYAYETPVYKDVNEQAQAIIGFRYTAEKGCQQGFRKVLQDKKVQM